jgi:uncharacterized protein with GYD domain
MAKYVVLVNWTEKGMSEAKGTIERSERVRQMVEKHGGSTDLLLWTMGRYDIVGIFDFPSDEVASTVTLQIGGLGTVRTETLRAFTADEMGSILGQLG